MYVVGASLLSDFWGEHPECEGQIRALHALLASARPADLPQMLGRTGRVHGGRIDLDLPSSRVSLDINEAAQVVRITGVKLKEGD